jgi:hypothetical protein
MEAVFYSDNIGEVAASGRKKQPLVVMEKRSYPQQDWERPSESIVLSSTCKPGIYLHPFAAFVGNFVKGKSSAAQHRCGLQQRPKKARISEKVRPA